MATTQKDSVSAITAATYAVIFIAVGLPLWWKTTEVYRYPIPHGECEQLVSAKVLHVVRVKLVLSDPSVQQGLLWEELLNFNEKENVESQDINISFDWFMRTTTEDEENAINSSKDIAELDAALNKLNKPLNHGELEILIFKKNFAVQSKFSIGQDRRGYILNDAEFHGLAKDISSLVKTVAQVDLLKKLYTSPSSTRSDIKPDKDRMRHIKSSSAFDVTFTLIVPEPNIVDIQWDAKAAIESYISPFLEEVSLISDVNVKSQILYMSALPIQFSVHPKTKEHIVRSENLALIINPVESRLGSDTTVQANLNFVIYIPTKEQAPLQIYDDDDTPVSTNAFLSPQWGGLMFWNTVIPEKNVSLPYKVDLDTHAIMEVFLTQLRLLLGLADHNEVAKDNYFIIPTTYIYKWELDFLLRKNTQEQLSRATSSLYSLSKLLETIPNIVIRDEIGEKIHFALISAKESLQLLQGGFLKEGFLKAKDSFVASEEAFFDPSLLALLYFPESQKYAIYTPLFLPVSLPVVASVGLLWKFWKDRKSKKD